MAESARRDRVLLALAVFAVLFAQVLLYPGVADLVAALGATDGFGASTWFLAVEFAGFVCFAGVWGLLSDRIGRRVPLVAVGALGGATGYTVIAALGDTVAFETLLFLRFAQGAFTVGAFSLATTMLMDLPGGHGRNMGAAGIAIGLGTALGAPVGGQLAERSPLLPLWVAAGGLLVVAVLVPLVTDRAPGSRRTRVADVARRLRERPALAYPYAFGFADRLTAGFFALVGTAYFREVFGLDAGGAGLVLGLFFAPFALLQYPLGVLSDRVGRKLPVAVGSLCYGAAVIAVYLAPGLWLAGAAMVALGVFGALVSPATMALVTDLAGDADRAVAMGGFNGVGNLGFLAGFAVGSVVTGAFGYGAAFAVAAALEAGIVVVVLPAFLSLDLSQTPTFRAS